MLTRWITYTTFVIVLHLFLRRPAFNKNSMSGTSEGINRGTVDISILRQPETPIMEDITLVRI